LLPALLPTLSDLGVWDQPGYITAGQQLLDRGAFPSFAGNPLTSVFYALTYLPFRSSSLWMVHSCSLGRLVLFGLLWVALYNIGRELSDLLPPLLLPGLLLVTPLAAEVMTFPSDPLFAGLAGLSFWQLLRHSRNGENRSLVLASLFLGLSALARNDGIVIFPIVLVWVIFISWRKPSWKKALLAVFLPFTILVGGYILGYGLFTGNFDPGTAARTYENFESGHQLLVNASGDINAVVESRMQAREVYGTPEENSYNVFRAILRNPAAYLERVRLVIPALFRALLSAYGKRFSPLLFPLAIQGLFLIAQRRDWKRLILFVLWPAHLLTGFIITIFRPGHLTFVYFIVYGLAGVGINAFLEMPARWKTRLLWFGITVGLGLYGWLDGKLAFTYAALVFLLALIVISLIQIRRPRASLLPALLVLAAAGITLRQGYPSLRFRNLGSSEPEQAVIFMDETIPRGSLIAAGSPGYIQAARMAYFGLASTDVPYDYSNQEFITWLQNQGVEYVFGDFSLWTENERAWERIAPSIGEELIEVFASNEGGIKIYQLLR